MHHFLITPQYQQYFHGSAKFSMFIWVTENAWHVNKWISVLEHVNTRHLHHTLRKKTRSYSNSDVVQQDQNHSLRQIRNLTCQPEFSCLNTFFRHRSCGEPYRFTGKTMLQQTYRVETVCSWKIGRDQTTSGSRGKIYVLQCSVFLEKCECQEEIALER